MILFICVTLFCSLHLSSGQQDARPDTPELPQVWGERQFFSEFSGAFRILSEIQLTKSKATFMLEEWALGEQQLYRLDITHKETGKGRTILSNGQSKEHYHYEPFVCSSIKNLTGSLSQELTEMFPQEHPFVLAGLASIWLKANKRIDRYRKSPKDQVSGEQVVTFRAADRSADSSSVKLRKSARRILKGFDQFEVDWWPKDEYRYKIVFYFHESSTLANEISPETVVAIHLVDPESSEVLMRAKIIEIETSNNAVSSIKSQTSLFELPLGYGCAKAERSAKPTNGYTVPEGLFTNSPHELALEVSALLPNHLEHDIDKWHVHSSSFRLLSGQLLGRQYLVINKQEFGKLIGEQSAFAGVKHKPRASHLNKLKRVWDLGPGLVWDNKLGEDKNGTNITEFNEQTTKSSVYYDIDEYSAECLKNGSASEGKLHQLPSVEFPLLTGDNYDQLQVAGLTFDVKTLMKLFYESYGYYLIREERTGWPNRKEIVYERRDDHFQLRSPATGDVVWEGPVSFVRRSKVLYEQYSTRDVPAQDKRVSVAIHLYTKKYDQLVGQIKLSLVPGRLVDLAYLHRGLSIEPCLWANRGHIVQTKQTNSIRFQIDYQYGGEHSQESAELLVEDGRAEEIIYEKFLFNSVKQLTNSGLDVLQFEDLLVSIKKRSVQISGKVYEWPHLFEFHRSEGQRLTSNNPNVSLVLRELKQNEAKCAETCSYYYCLQFSYCPSSRVCHILMDDMMAAYDEKDNSGGLPKALAYHDDKDCALFTRRSDKYQSIRPVDFIHQVKRVILSESGDEPNPMAIQFELLDNSTDNQISINLIPTYIDTVDSTGNSMGQQSSKQIQLDYEILMSGKKFKRLNQLSDIFPIQEANHVSYEDCESICEQNDCRSFSYCQIDKTCQVSKLHRTDLIDQSAEQATDSTCRIMALNYQSKFQSIKRRRTRPLGVVKDLEVVSGRDCALSCLEEQEFNCRSFWFCSRTPTTKHNCFLRKTRDNPMWSPAGLRSEATNDATSSVDCELYLRSYLADFDHFYGKKLGPTFENDLVDRDNVNAEKCASECVDNEELNCRAFHVCQNGHAATCTLLIGRQVASNDTPVNYTISGGDLEDAMGCTTFLLPSNVGLKFGLNLVSMDDLAEQNDGTMTPTVGQDRPSRWLIDFFIIGSGLLVGYALSWTFVSFNH